MTTMITLLVLTALGAAAVTALLGALLLDQLYRRGYQAGRETGYKAGHIAGCQAGREERAAEHYARGYEDATTEINARREAEDHATFVRGYRRCMEDCGIEEITDQDLEAMERAAWQPAMQIATAA